MNLSVPDPSLILLVGTAGSGKSTFARRHFKPTEILSSDFFRGLIADDESDQAVTADAFHALSLIAAARLRNRRLTVIDATNVQRRARRPLLRLARRHQTPTVAIVFDLPEAICLERDAERAERQVGAAVIHEQFQRLQQALLTLPHEGFQSVFIFRSPDEISAPMIERFTVAPSAAL
jgi:predicted kinase